MAASNGGKQVKGRQRHLLVDREGVVLRAVVHGANIMDRDGVKLVLQGDVRTQFPRLQHVWLDAAYNGKGKGGERQGLDRAAAGVDRADRAASAALQEDLGPQRHPTRADRLVQVAAAAGLPGPPPPLGGRKDVRLARPAAPTQQGL